MPARKSRAAAGLGLPKSFASKLAVRVAAADEAETRAVSDGGIS